MTPAQYLDAAKAELAISADNELAKRFGTTRQRISAYRNGSVWPDNYIVMKLAITLKPVSYTHLDGYKRQPVDRVIVSAPNA